MANSLEYEAGAENVAATAAAVCASASGEPYSPQNPARLVVFDFDGTSISGNSPVKLCFYLNRHHLLSRKAAAAVIAWGAAYSLHIPQNESWVRGQVFSSFTDKTVEWTDDFLRTFYDEEIEPLWRPTAGEVMRRHAEAGDVVLVVSATFEPIIKRAMELHPFENQVSVRMKTDGNGHYTRQVDGMPTEGEEKIRAVQRFGDEHFGPGNWVIARAYADHYSDIPLMEAAQERFAVTPSPALSRYAKAHGWTILNWEDPYALSK